MAELSESAFVLQYGHMAKLGKILYSKYRQLNPKVKNRKKIEFKYTFMIWIS
jgi:hypothetical protein